MVFNTKNARRVIAVGVTIVGFGATAAVGTSLAATSPNGPGQPGAPGTTCGSMDANATPGNTATANGSPFNPAGVSGANYAGSTGTPSAANAASTHAISQYDIACFQAASRP